MTLALSNLDFQNGLVLDGQTTDNPLIFYSSFYDNVGITTDPLDSPVPSRPVTNLWSPDTSSVWEGRGQTTGSLTTLINDIFLENPNNENIDYVAIAKHNLSYQYPQKQFRLSIDASFDGGSTYVSASPISITVLDENPLVWFFDEIAPDIIRVRIRAESLSITPPVLIPSPIIGHIKAGKTLVLQRREFSGVASGSLYKNVRRTQNMSDNGQYLGQVIISSKRSQPINQENNTPVFVRDNIRDFISHVQGEPVTSGGSPSTFFYAWRPNSYPDDIVYGWTNDTISPAHQSGDSFGGRMSWSCGMECIN